MMQFEWVRWRPDENHECDAPDKVLVDAINVALRNVYGSGRLGDTPNAETLFWNLMQAWHNSFPGKCVLITLTQEGVSDTQQLRAWFGEPASFRSGYVDSMGKHLIAHAAGPLAELRDLIPGLLPHGKMEEFKKQIEKGVTVWRREQKEK